MQAMTATDQLLSQDLILQSVPDAIVVSDTHDRIVVWNPAAEVIYGWSAGDVIGKVIAEVIPVLRYLNGASHETVTTALATHGSWAGQFIQVHRNGQERAIDGTVRLIRDAQGEVIASVAINHEITARKQAEQALRETEARYRTLVEHFPNGSVFLFDRDLRYTLAGGTGLAASGLSREMFEGKTLAEIFPPEIAARDEPVLRAALAGATTRVEVPFGAATFVVHTLPVADEHGTIVGGMVMTQDITERKRAEAHLHFLAEASAILGASLDSEAMLQGIARLAVPLLGNVCVVYIVAPEGTIQRVVTAHVDPVTEEQMRALHDRRPIDRAGPHPAAVAIRTGQPVIPAAAGEASEQDAAQMILPLVAGQHVLGAIAFGRGAPDRDYDPAELQLAEELARRAAQAMDHARLYRDAQAALRTRDEFVSIAAHELKTPLTTLLGTTEVLQRRAARAQPYILTDRDRQTLEVIVQQSRRLQQQIDTLLDLSQIQAGQLRLDLQPTDLGSLVGRVVDDIQHTLERHQVAFMREESPLIINGDALRLEQVAQNLLQNAIKYSPDGGSITVVVTQEGTAARLTVSDQGIGIPAKAQAQLFERFYRASNATGSGVKGLGIGLAVVEDIVARHGGWVEVASVEGQGSTFSVYLPLAGTTSTSVNA